MEKSPRAANADLRKSAQIFNKKLEQTATVNLSDIVRPDNDHLKGYIIARGEEQRLGIPNITSMNVKTKRTTFIDDYNKSKAHVQAPNKY